MPGSVIKVSIVEDSVDEREALRRALSSHPEFECEGVFADGESALLQIPKIKPHIALMDIQLPGISGIDCIRKLSAQLPSLRILMLTVFADHDRIFQSLQAGASGYLLKNTAPARLIEAIREVHEGGAPMSAPIARKVVDWFQKSTRPAHPDVEKLSRREEQILSLLAKGALYKEIAIELGIGVGSVRTYIRRIYEKLHVRSRTEAILKVLPSRR